MERKVTKILTDFQYKVGGREWIFPRVELEEAPCGTTVFPGREITRMHETIAADICGTCSALTGAELEFLSDITAMLLEEVADKIGVPIKTLIDWLDNKNAAVPLHLSLVLKKWFWGKVFQLADRVQIPVKTALSDEELLPVLRSLAIEHVLKQKTS